MVAKLSYLLLISAILMSLSGCLKVESFPDEPVVAFQSLIIEDNSASLNFSFTDGDGNFGLTEEDANTPPFDGDDFKHNLIVDYYEKIGDTWQRFGNDFSQTSPFFIITGFNARVEHLIPEGTNKTQQGEISYMISPYFNPVTENDSARFTFYLLDRDLNQSNLETTTAFKKP